MTLGMIPVISTLSITLHSSSKHFRAWIFTSFFTSLAMEISFKIKSGRWNLTISFWCLANEPSNTRAPTLVCHLSEVNPEYKMVVYACIPKGFIFEISNSPHSRAAVPCLWSLNLSSSEGRCLINKGS